MHDEQKIPESNMGTDTAQSGNYLCNVCGQAKIDLSESANSVLCRSCREKMIHYPIPRVFILFSVIVVILIGVAFYHFPKVMECYKMYENSVVLAEHGEISAALYNLNSVLEQYPDSVPVSTRMTDIAMGEGYYDIAANVINTYLYNKEIDEDVVDRLNQYVERIDRFYTSYDAIEEMESKLDPTLPQEAAKKASYEYINGLLGDPNQDKALLYYYLSMYSEDIDEVRVNLEKCLKEDENLLDAKVQMANLLRRQGDFTNAEKRYNELLSKDKYSDGALRGLAIIRLLEGNKEEGLNLAYKAFDTNPDGLYVWETYIIALKENDKNSETDDQIKEYLAAGYELDEDTQNYLEGEISLYDYYIGE